MFTPRTVFVVGAGASHEVGLPIGDGLRNRIVELTHHDHDGFSNRDFLNAAIRLCQGNQSVWSKIFPAVTQLRNGLPNVASIDTYLDIHRNNELMISCGKMAIVIAILESERESDLSTKFKLRANYQNDESFRIYDTDKYDKSWYVYFGRLLTQGISIENVDSIFDNVSFITFNYDRCIETFAYEWLKQTFGLTEHHAREVASKLEVLHVYGSIGPLPWQNGDVPFGFRGDLDWPKISRGVKTFTESVDSEITDRIQNRIADADTLVILGFGWLRQNLEILNAGQPTQARRIFFTTNGVSDSDRETVTADLARLVGQPVYDNGDWPWRAFEERATCADLFKNNWRQLTRE